jgi:4-amino-4-deoxy-L-arabinose transferase-like glycosyltransferase
MKISSLKILINKIPKRIWILILIILIGIFLRTYHFRDWLVFNPDQARDAMVVDDVLSGRSSWLILGPEAGNTHFDLGPWFYHLEIISAKIFGNSPDKMAYPDLLFSILAIPLFYILVKKYFTSNLSLALTGIYTASFFAVRYSRFAWNPNSIPFFVLLFLLGILNLLEPDKRKNFRGAVMAGIGIGVGIQLHILLFFIMPSVTALVFLYLFLKKIPIVTLVKKIGIIFLLILITNAGQIIYGMNHKGSNMHVLVKASESSEVKFEIGKSLPMDLICQVQANLHMITSLGNTDQCDFYQVFQKNIKRNNLVSAPKEGVSIALVIIGVLFSFGGYVILMYFWRNEADERRKNFLALIGTYGIVSLLVMLPIINQAEIRYYIVSFFLPFIFLGIMIEELLRRKNVWIKVATVLVFAALLILNGATEAKTAEQFFAQKANNDKDCYLGEIGAMADYLIANTNGSRIAFLRGNNDYLARYFKPLNYFAKKSGIDLKHYDKEEADSHDNIPVFYVVKSRSDKYWIGGDFKHSTIKQLKTFNNITIIIPSDY